MVNSRDKGARGEYAVRDLLRKYTGHQFERVPTSGALSYLKGDLHIPSKDNRFCIEVKNYMDSPLSDKLFTNKSNYIVKWWPKLLDDSKVGDKEPLLFFKYSRSKVFVLTEIEPVKTEKFFYISWLNCYVMLAEDWLQNEKVSFING